MIVNGREEKAEREKPGLQIHRKTIDVARQQRAITDTGDSICSESMFQTEITRPTSDSAYLIEDIK